MLLQGLLSALPYNHLKWATSSINLCVNGIGTETQTRKEIKTETNVSAM
jgi:hypothetical protein